MTEKQDDGLCPACQGTGVKDEQSDCELCVGSGAAFEACLQCGGEKLYPPEGHGVRRPCRACADHPGLSSQGHMARVAALQKQQRERPAAEDPAIATAMLHASAARYDSRVGYREEERSNLTIASATFDEGESTLEEDLAYAEQQLAEGGATEETDGGD